jgi:DNA-binding NtrC family response regulator
MKMQAELIGKSKAIRNITKQIGKLSKRNDNVLIVGERGVGKGEIARSLHTLSNDSADQVPFLVLNPASVHEDELSAILFGYHEGTPGLPDTSRNGLAEIATGGTILIEEIETAGHSNQIKILNFLSEISSGQNRKNDPAAKKIRVIVTAKEDPVKLAEKNEILAELAEQLSSFQSVIVPPLRERKEDIPHLIEHFINVACAKIGIGEPVMDINAISILVNQPWKRNIHELKAVIDRSVLFSSNGMFTLPQDMVDEGSKVTRMLETILTDSGQEINSSLDTIERGLIGSALQRFGNNLEKAAGFLGMNRDKLEHRASQLGLVRVNK